VSRGPSPIVRRRRLGAELRRLREVANLTGDQVIARVGWASASKLSRLENGRSRPDVADVLDLLDLYAVTGPDRDELVAIARDASNRQWLREYPVMTHRQRGYAELESGCVDIREFAPAIVPGLLQTPAYARVRILSAQPLQLPDGDRGLDPEVEVAARLARQKILSRGLEPPEYEAVLAETALTARGGPVEVMHEQLNYLRQLAALPNVTLRVLTRDATIGEFYLPHTAFSLYRFADPADPETVAVEALAHDLVLTERPEITRYKLLFDWLRQAALTAEESLYWLDAAPDRLVVGEAPAVTGTPEVLSGKPEVAGNSGATVVNGRSAPRPRRSEPASKHPRD
jgi:transcriptional regulator with XRE-family HTH domain